MFRKTAFRVVISLFLLSAAAAVTLACFILPDDELSAGVRVAGFDLSGKKVSEAREVLLGWEAEVLRSSLRLISDGLAGGSWTATPADLGLRLDVETTLRNAAAVGRNTGAFERLMAWFKGHEVVEIAAVWQAEVSAARSYLKKNVASSVARSRRDATVHWANGAVRIVPERNGVRLDIPETVNRLIAALPAQSGAGLELAAVVALQELPARITAEALRSVDGEIGSYQTHYAERGNRRLNIVTACSRIHGTILMPGDVFSYNKAVGPRDAEAGFRLAPVIVRGRMEPGMGGGICQTSSTLYNAILRAGLEIVSRRHHAFPVHYVPPGLDATVVYPSIDFRFRNTTGSPIVLLADASRQRVRIQVMGASVPGRKIEIVRTGVSSWPQKTVTIRQQGLPAGKRVVIDKGHSGHRATVWRIVRDPGQAPRKERISSDVYGAIPRLVAVGPDNSPAPRETERTFSVPTGSPLPVSTAPQPPVSLR